MPTKKPVVKKPVAVKKVAIKKRTAAPRLTATEIRALKAKVKAELNGKSQNVAAMEAFPGNTPGSAAVRMTRELKKPNVQQALQEALERHGITVDSVLAPIAAGLTAVKEEFTEQGLVTSVDHNIRLRASGMGAKYLGLEQKEKDPTGNTFNFINAPNANFNAQKYTD